MPSAFSSIKLVPRTSAPVFSLTISAHFFPSISVEQKEQQTILPASIDFFIESRVLASTIRLLKVLSASLIKFEENSSLISLICLIKSFSAILSFLFKSLLNKLIFLDSNSFKPKSILIGTPFSSQVLNFSPGLLSLVSITTSKSDNFSFNSLALAINLSSFPIGTIAMW